MPPQELRWPGGRAPPASAALRAAGAARPHPGSGRPL